MDRFNLVVRAHEMNRDMEKLRAITEPNKDMYRNKLAESAVKDNLYNRGYRNGYNAAQKEQKWGCYSCANFLGNQSMFLCEHCVDRSNWRKNDE